MALVRCLVQKSSPEVHLNQIPPLGLVPLLCSTKGAPGSEIAVGSTTNAMEEGGMAVVPRSGNSLSPRRQAGFTKSKEEARGRASTEGLRCSVPISHG